MVKVPFKEQPSHWVLPEGNEPFRSASAIPPTHLLS
jgi:hypothetical protein